MSCFASLVNMVGSELMNGDNYDHWMKAIEVALIAKKKLGFVPGGGG